ncbi:DUF4296 domain-containing protein [Urechidicola vernalis]|uniref:DUF4296 domain-containing protein n=1 Tax=Urechidicola vernalis TaxID=3075600 RepID=A0ABU2Y8R9_9FLAO|nr:DUF4296 domain-containing protein [Urechidicola sp. P050]MDT0553660.1 DUF4296 domain-containing protein [Urechidicola sp. P050]
MKQFSLYILLILFIVSCTSNTIYKRPDDLIKKDEMIALILDIQLANGARNIKNSDGQRLVEYMPLVYEKYGIDSARFARSNYYYSTRIDDYTKMLRAVKERLGKMEKDYDRKVFVQDSIDGKYNNSEEKRKRVAQLDENRINLISFSEDFNNSIWLKGNSGDSSSPIIISNFASAPNGQDSADKIIFEIKPNKNQRNRSWIRQKVGKTNNPKILSCWMKSADNKEYIIGWHTGSVRGVVNVTDKWTRYVFEDKLENSIFAGLEITNKTSAKVSILLWGFQVEESKSVSDYRKTEEFEIGNIQNPKLVPPPQTEGIQK